MSITEITAPETTFSSTPGIARKEARSGPGMLGGADETLPRRGLSRDAGNPVGKPAGMSRDGFPEPLPEGEPILWEGAPDARAILRDVLHARAVLAYFGLLAGGQLAVALGAGRGTRSAIGEALWIVPAAAASLALLAAFAWLVARTTRYTITGRRVVLRFGIALPVTLNLPFAAIAGADMTRRADGTGGIALQLIDPRRVLYATLWPHARPWHVGTPQPMLRGLRDAERVATLLAAALRRTQEAGGAPRVRLVSSAGPAAPAPVAA